MSAVNIVDILRNLGESSGFADVHWQQIVMIVVACVLLFLGIAKKFEPLLLVGMLLGGLTPINAFALMLFMTIGCVSASVLVLGFTILLADKTLAYFKL